MCGVSQGFVKPSGKLLCLMNILSNKVDILPGFATAAVLYDIATYKTDKAIYIQGRLL